MSENNQENKLIDVKELCEEGIRLFDRAQELMGEVEAGQGVMNEEGSLRSELDAQSHICEAEKKKLSELDFVVVVVGTMKAGKSTTINAIVGAELLPNRNTPMTTIPTRIRHNPNIQEIKLALNTDTARNLTNLLNKHRVRIKQLLTGSNSALNPEKRKFFVDILKIDDFKPNYHGIDEIYTFLKNLNDLARACKDLDDRFPYEDYTLLENLPLIEARFAALDEVTNSTGATFTLLDTPGANEAGQRELKGVVDNQIKNASGILLITDYTQMRSEADDDIRKTLEDYIKNYPDKVYVLVNKFDSKNSNDLDRDDTKNYVSGLFAPESETSALKEDNIYPVSAERAYLSNRMRLARKSGEPMNFASCEKTWLDDFGKKAYSDMWEDYKEEWVTSPDWERIERSWKKMWENSYFQKPLDEVIARGYRKAAFNVLGTGIQKLKDLSGNLEDMVNNRINMLQDNEKSLQDSIEKTEQQIAVMESQSLTTLEKGGNALIQLKKVLDENFNSIRKSLKEDIDRYFKKGKIEEGKRKEEELKAERKNKNQTSPFSGIFSKITGGKNENKSDFDPEKPEIEFSSKGEARNFLDKVENRIREICDKSQKDFENIVNDCLDKMEERVLNPMVKEAKNSLESFAQELGKTGIRFKFKDPSLDTIRLRVDIDDFLDKAIDEETRTETHSRRQKGLWGWVCKLFDTDDWGWEEYDVEKRYYKVYLVQLRNSANHSLQTMNTNLSSAIESRIAEPLGKKINEFYNQYLKEMENLKQDYINAINDIKSNQINIKKTIEEGNKIKKDLGNFSSEIEGLSKRSEEIFAAI